MSTIVTRAGKGSPLTWNEVDNNFTNLNTDKLQSGNTAAALTITSATINGGTITGTALNGTLGATTPSTIAATTISASGVSTFSAGSAGAPAITTAGDTNTGMFFPAADTIAFSEGGTESMRIDSNGRLGIGTTIPLQALDVRGRTGLYGASDAYQLKLSYALGTAGFWLGSPSANALSFYNDAGTERMRIDSSGNLGLGVTPTQKLHVSSTGNNVIISETTGASNIAQVRASGTSGRTSYLWQASASYPTYQSLVANNAGIYGTTNLSYEADGAFFQSWWTNASERMRIHSSGGVSIGNTTDSGAGVLNVNTSVIAPFAKLTANGTGSSNAGLLLDYAGVVQWQIYPETTTGALTVISAGATRLKIDTSGNLGLGVTPATWSGAAKAIQIGAYNILYNLGDATYYGSNYSFNGTNRVYLNSSKFALEYLQYANDGSHRWYNAPSGTAGGTVTFTERMTLNASGNLGIGTTSPVTKLVVSNSGAAGFEFNPNASGGIAQVEAYNRSTSAYVPLSLIADDIRFRTGSTATERMRIDTSGNVGIGTASPASSAILDAQSTTKGVRMPNMTTTQKNAIASPVAGLMVFDTTLAKLCVYSGSAWQTITSV